MSKDNLGLITILVIDDDVDFVDKSLRLEGRSKRIKIEHVTNLVEGKNILEKNKSIVGVVLDVRCQVSPNHMADKSFIVEALDELKKICPDLPRVILTGDDGLANEVKSYNKGEMVFEKGRADDTEKMFDHLRQRAADNDYLKVARKYRDIFELFDHHFDEEKRRDLYLIIKNMHQKDSIGGNLRCIRLMQEAIYQALFKHNPTIVPLEYLDKKYNPNQKSDKSDRSEIVSHLINNGYIEGRDSIIFREGELIQRITSHYANHPPLVPPKFPPTIYTVQMCVFATLDLFLWFKGIVETDHVK